MCEYNEANALFLVDLVKFSAIVTVIMFVEGIVFSLWFENHPWLFLAVVMGVCMLAAYMFKRAEAR